MSSGSAKVKGIIYAILAAATYGMIPLFTIPLYNSGMDTDSVLVFRYFFAVVAIGLLAKLRGRSLKLERGELFPLMGVGLVMSVSSLALFSSYHYMDGGIASTLLFVYPIIVALIMTIFFKEKLKIGTVICMVVALAGIALLYKGEDGAELSVLGTMLVMVSAICYSIYIVGVNRSALKKIPTLKLNFYMLIFGGLVFFVRVNMGLDLTVPTEWDQWACLAALGLFPTAVSFICTTLAVQNVGATPTAILGVVEPFTAIIIGVTVFGEPLTMRIASGLLMIIVSVTFVVGGTNIRVALVRFKKLFPKVRK